jgi:hypothetical protein
LAGELRALVVGSALALVVACGASTKQQGGLEVVIRSDLPAGSFNHLHVKVEQEVSPGGAWNTLLDVPDGAPTLPTRLAITAGSAADQEARITVTALLGTQVVVQDIAQVQVPTDRVGELDLLLSQVCVGVVCSDPNKTCDPTSGLCVSNMVTTIATFGEDAGADAGPDAESGTSGTGASSSGTLGSSSGPPTTSTIGGTTIGSSSGFGSSSGLGTTGTGTTGGITSSGIGVSSGPWMSSSGPPMTTGGPGASSGPPTTTGGPGTSSGPPTTTGGGIGSSSGLPMTTGGIGGISTGSSG